MKILTGFSKKIFEEDAIFEVLDNIINDDTKLVLYFVSSNYSQEKIAHGVKEYINKVAYKNEVKIIGASTAGEIFNGEFLTNSITAISFSGDFEVGVGLCERVSVKGMITGSEMFEKACISIGKIPDAIKGESRYEGKYLGICLHDGLSNIEEFVMLTLKNAAGNIPVVGGSAADSLKFERTYLHVNGDTYIDTCVLILIEMDIPFEVGYTINYIPTSDKMKVTKANFKKRIVNEIDYSSCANLYGKFRGKSPEELKFYDLLANPLGVNYNNEIYLRSPIKVNSDGSMGFLCFLKEEQEVFCMKQQSMVEELIGLVYKLKRKLGSIGNLLVFNCAYRYLEILRDKNSQEIKSIFNDINVIGMNTFGQQLNSMHMNQALTYVAFGARK